MAQKKWTKKGWKDIGRKESGGEVAIKSTTGKKSKKHYPSLHLNDSKETYTMGQKVLAQGEIIGVSDDEYSEGISYTVRVKAIKSGGK